MKSLWFVALHRADWVRIKELGMTELDRVDVNVNVNVEVRGKSLEEFTWGMESVGLG